MFDAGYDSLSGGREAFRRHFGDSLRMPRERDSGSCEPNCFVARAHVGWRHGRGRVPALVNRPAEEALIRA